MLSGENTTIPQHFPTSPQIEKNIILPQFRSKILFSHCSAAKFLFYHNYAAKFLFSHYSAAKNLFSHNSAAKVNIAKKTVKPSLRLLRSLPDQF
jgi:hypothetical protein